MAKKTGYLPELVKTKIYKTGQTRGADDDVIFQNRVGRSSTVLIPYDDYKRCSKAPADNGIYENGFIVLISPEEYFTNGILYPELVIGENLLVFYETRKQWFDYPPLPEWMPASARKYPLNGQFVARIPATTSEGQTKIIRGFNTSSMKGAGIRVYEYANSTTIKECRIQLELLFWSCKDIERLIQETVNPKAVREYVLRLKKEAYERELYDKKRLIKERIIDEDGFTICPLCLKHISAIGFVKKMQQADGRYVPDLTVTEISLFHIKELRTGEFNHRPYNLGWGHHHCNVVVRDSGIKATLEWMRQVLIANGM